MDYEYINGQIKTAINLSNENKFEEANEIYFQLLDLITDSNKKIIYFNIATIYRKLHNFKKSIDFYNKAIEIDLNYVNAYNGLFDTYAYFGDYSTAFKYQEWSFADSFLSHPSLEISKEKRLDWMDANVQKSLYTRFNIKPENDIIETDESIYDEILYKIENKILYLRSSQGIGDIIQCSLLIKELLRYNPKKIIFVVNYVVFRLLSQLNSKIIEIRLEIPKENEFDFFIPIFSLIKLLKIDNTPKDKWLYIENKDLIFSKFIISQMTNKVKIAINWRGNPNHINDKHRSLTLDDILKRLSLSNSEQIFSIQINPTDEEKEIMINNNIIDLSGYIKDSYDMGMFLSQMALLVSIDSAPIHIAGALGVDSFLLIPSKNEDWRWGAEGNKKWYNSVKIFRI